MIINRKSFKHIARLPALVMLGFLMVFGLFSPEISQATVGAPVDLTITSEDELIVGEKMKVVITIEIFGDFPDARVELKIPYNDWTFFSGQTLWAGPLKAGTIEQFEVIVIPKVPHPEPLWAKIKVPGWAGKKRAMDMNRLGGRKPEFGLGIKATPENYNPANDILRPKWEEELPISEPVDLPQIPGQPESAIEDAESAVASQGGVMQDVIVTGTVTVTATGRWMYLDNNGIEQGTRLARVRIMDEDPWYTWDAECASGLTDINGYFNLTGSCTDTGDNPDIYVEVCATSGGKGFVNPPGIGAFIYCSVTPTRDGFGGGTIDYGSWLVDNRQHAAFHLFNQLVQAWQYFQALGSTVPSVEIDWPESGDASEYIPYFSEINIVRGAGWVESTFMHEYGHHVLSSLAESPDQDYDNGICNNSDGDPSHCMWAPEKGVVSWTEGWPNFLSAVLTRIYNHDNHNMVENHWFCKDSNCTGSCNITPGGVGCIYSGQEKNIEGFIAAILWDIYDGNGSPPGFSNDDQHNDGQGRLDNIFKGFEEIWDVVLHYNPPGSREHPVSIDQFYDGMKARYGSWINDIAEVYREHHIIKPQPDLDVISLTNPPANLYLGESFSMTSTIENIGNETAINPSTTVYLSTDSIISSSDRPIALYSVPQLAVGATYTRTITVTMPGGIAEYDYYLGVCADGEKNVPESIEINNCRSSTTQIHLKPRTIRIISPGLATWFIGASRTIMWSSDGAGPMVKIDISRDGGSTWSLITGLKGTSNDGSYTWTVTSSITDAARIRVTSKTYPNVSGTSGVFYIKEPSLTIHKTGTGTGTVTSSPVGIDCGTDCFEYYPYNTTVTLTAIPTSGSVFAGWAGDCPGTATTTTVTITEAHDCYATFNAANTLTVTKAGTGNVLVLSNPPGIDCGTDCSEGYEHGTMVGIRAYPESNTTFVGWAGDCSGSSIATLVTMDADKTCTAVSLLKQSLTITKSGTGTCTVTSSPSGINCGTDCSEMYDRNTVVTLTATPASGHTFASWSGDCSGTNTTTTVTMNADKTCNAQCNAPPSTYTLSVTKLGTGSGTVTSNPSGINCGVACSYSYPNTSSVELIATANGDSTFEGWGGDCSGTNTTTQVTMGADRTCTATFTAVIPAAEREALIDLYNSTNGDNWTNNTNWLGPVGTECTWYGVTCAANRVQKLDLKDNNLNGVIPASLGNISGLINLTYLNLSENQISDISSLSGLTNLTNLLLYNNQISDISPLAGLINLTYLRLETNQISDISALSGLTALNALWLGVNQIIDISALSGLTNLQALYLNGNQISDLSALSGLTNLVGLYLGGNQISDISVLAGLTNLTTLTLTNNQISDLSPLSGLTNLTILYLHTNQISDISALSGLTNLNSLWLETNQISDLSALSGLINLTDLRLVTNQISDISALSGLINLTELRLAYNQISDISTLSALTNLQVLYLYQNQISDISPLSGLANLTHLNLTTNQISDISPLSGLTNLSELRLGHNQISDLSALAGQTNLKVLHLYQNQISVISALSGLINLNVLQLSTNQISDVSALSGMTNLTELYFNGNQLSDISVINSANMPNLNTLNLENNSISDISSISGLINLTSLRLTGNLLEDTDLLNLTGLTSLTDLTLAKIRSVIFLHWQDCLILRICYWIITRSATFLYYPNC